MRYCAILILLCSPTFGEDIFQPTGRYVVKTETKQFVAMFTAPWCGPCQTWKRTERHKVEATGLTVIEHDITVQTRYTQVSRGKRQIVRLPTFVLCDWQTGEWLGQPVVGTMEADQLILKLKIKGDQ